MVRNRSAPERARASLGRICMQGSHLRLNTDIFHVLKCLMRNAQANRLCAGTEGNFCQVHDNKMMLQFAPRPKLPASQSVGWTGGRYVRDGKNMRLGAKSSVFVG